MKKVILAIISASILSSAFAAGWVGNWKRFQVNTIVFEGSSSGTDAVFTTKTAPTATEISAVTGVSYSSITEPQFFKVDGSTQKGKYIISTLMLAKTTGSNICIHVESVQAGRPVVSGIHLD
jgi:hypothetical protein